ncbi:MAG: MFS transporter [Candidatus Omnitrophota bacterium]|nr:MFS transporter [Candidatus Omnitrophota bacterium]
MPKRRFNLLQICNMSVGFMGIQFGWGLQMANMSAIYEYLGAQPDKIPILWLAAPLTGLLVQPFIGHMSDHTWCWLGRRRPYFLVGAVLATCALFFMPYSGSLLMAAGLLWVMDASVNISMEPFRAFVADLLPEEQRTFGFTMQGVFIGLGAVTASALPWLLENVFGLNGTATAPHPLAATAPAHGAAHHVQTAIPAVQSAIPGLVRISFHIGAAVFLGAVLWTILTTKEYPPADIRTFREMKSKKGRLRSAVKEIFHDLLRMPPTMKELAWVQIFSWMGLFCMFIYFPVTVANNIFGATEGTNVYLRGIEWAGICFATYNAVCFLVSLFLSRIAGKITRRYTHMLCLLCGAAGLLGIMLVHDKNSLLLLMVGVGIAWASILAMPYAILSTAIPQEKMGVYMGIFNFFITIPQILVSLGLGWIMFHWLGNNRLYGVAIGGICMLIASFLMLRVRDRGAEKRRGHPESWIAPTGENN